MIRLTALTLAAIALAALALTACSDDSGGAADPNSDAGIFYCDLRTDCPDGYTCFDGRCIYQGPGAPDPTADATVPAPPEVEQDITPTPPAAGRDHVWITAPANDAIARIHGRTLTVTVIEIGDDPHAIVTLPGQDTALVLARGEDRLALIRHADGRDTITHHDLPGHMNALTLAPDGRHAYAWFDLATAHPGEDASALQDLAVFDLQTTRIHPIAIGFAPRRITFAADGTALVITQDGLSIIRPDTLDGPAIAPTIPLAPDVFAPADREVIITPDGRYAASRGPGEPGITVVDLTEAIPRFIPLEGEPTDLDLLPDGRALVMLREARHLALIPLATATDPATIRTIPFADLPLGSAVISPLGDRALLFATRPDAPPTAALLALPGGEIIRLPLRKRALGAAIDPTGATALVLHAPEAPADPQPRGAPLPDAAPIPDAEPDAAPDLDAGIAPDLDAELAPDPDAAVDPDPDAAVDPDAAPDSDAAPDPDATPDAPPDPTLGGPGPEVDPDIAPHAGYSLIDLDTAFVKLTLTPAPVTALLFTPAGPAFLALAGPTTTEIHRLDLTRFDARRYPLGSPPRALGHLPAINRAFITQDHPTGRISFLPIAPDDRLETVTGFALNGRIE